MNKVRWGDVVIGILFVVAIVFSILALKKKSAGKSQLIISAGNKEYVYPMDKDGLYSIPGLLGDSQIRVENGKARFENSPCPSKTCVQTGFISKNGTWAACLPNQVFIRIESPDDELDAVAF